MIWKKGNSKEQPLRPYGVRFTMKTGQTTEKWYTNRSDREREVDLLKRDRKVNPRKIKRLGKS